MTRFVSKSDADFQEMFSAFGIEAVSPVYNGGNFAQPMGAKVVDLVGSAHSLAWNNRGSVDGELERNSR